MKKANELLTKCSKKANLKNKTEKNCMTKRERKKLKILHGGKVKCDRVVSGSLQGINTQAKTTENHGIDILM